MRKSNTVKEETGKIKNKENQKDNGTKSHSARSM